MMSFLKKLINKADMKEGSVMGKKLIYSIVSVVIGGGIVLLVYPYVGLTTSAYIAITVVAPIALTGFYSYNGMTFMEMMKLKAYYDKKLKVAGQAGKEQKAMHTEMEKSSR